MKSKFRILTGVKNDPTDDTITIEPTVSLGDIPYYIEFDFQSNKDSVFKNIYVASSEKNEKQTIDSTEIVVGNKSGKIYQVKFSEPLNRKLLSTVFKKLLSKNSDKLRNENRFNNNIHYSIEIINKTYNRLIETKKLKELDSNGEGIPFRETQIEKNTLCF